MRLYIWLTVLVGLGSMIYIFMYMPMDKLNKENNSLKDAISMVNIDRRLMEINNSFLGKGQHDIQADLNETIRKIEGDKYEDINLTIGKYTISI